MSGVHAETRVQPTSETAAHRLKTILQSYKKTVFKYRHYVEALTALNACGVLEHFNDSVSERIHGSHRVIHDRHLNSITIVRPHGHSAEHKGIALSEASKPLPHRLPVHHEDMTSLSHHGHCWMSSSTSLASGVLPSRPERPMALLH